MNKHFLTFLAFFTMVINTSGQISIFQTPKPASPLNHDYPNMQITPGNPNMPNPANSMEIYRQEQQELQRRNAQNAKILNENSRTTRIIQYDLPSRRGTPGAEYYPKALEKLCNMLSGKSPVNLKDAVFTVENAYLENRLDYSELNKAINKLIETAQLKAKQDGYNWKNPITKNIMLFRAMADTLEIKDPVRETTVVSYPVQYDFDDPEGREDWAKMFVSKLLASQKGQCHSMPLLYLILCEETGTEANLAFSPSHSYIKFKDPSGNWYNLELTNGRIVSDAFIAGSGYITSEAIKNRIYMEPQTKRQTIAACLADLATGYVEKYGYDRFLMQCADSILKYDQHNLKALMLKADYHTMRLEFVIRQTGRLHPNDLKRRYPRAYQLFEDRNAAYRQVDATGYREMPKEAYRTWLNSVNREKERRENAEKYNRVLQLIR